MKTTLLTFVLATAGLCAAELPVAETLFLRYVDATGGMSAYSALKSQVITGNMEFVGQGVSGKLTSWIAIPGRVRTTLDLAGIGKVESGMSGGKGWQNSAMQGARLMEGPELAQMTRMSRLNAMSNWREYYESATTEAAEDVDGKPCYRVAMVPKGDTKAELIWFDKESGLVAQSRMTLQSPAGEMMMESRPSDYREVGGLKLAHKLVQAVGPTQVRTIMEKIEINVEIPASQFEPPAEVKALMNK